MLLNQFHFVLDLASKPKTPLARHQTSHRLRSPCPKYVQHNYLEHHLEVFVREHNSKGMRQHLKQWI